MNPTNPSKLIDTHSHIYDEAFDLDRIEAIQRAKSVGITHIILPNIDSDSLPRMLATETENLNYCHAAIGLHPTSVKENYKSELALVESELKRREWIAIGEIGIDLYWDKTFVAAQIICFQQQIEWALEYNLPVIIHVRNAFRETMQALKPYKDKGLKGVFHSFTKSINEANEIIDFGGFKLGINGVVTFKNAGIASVIAEVDPKHLILETDAPYLTPAPHRGRRNESAYTAFVCEKVAEICMLTPAEIDRITTQSALELFKIQEI